MAIQRAYPKLQELLFIDVETVSACAQYADLDDEWKQLWDKKAAQIAKNGEAADALYPRAAIYAEFGKIICISAGFFSSGTKPRRFRVKSFIGHNETEILGEFAHLLRKHFSKPQNLLVAHNGKEFDFPFIARRMLVNGIQLPEPLRISGKKPWEILHIDTMELWKFGDYKHYTSLQLLSKLFSLPSPKTTMEGSMVHSAYYIDHALDAIGDYCQQDVVSLARIYLCLTGHTPGEIEKIEFIS